MSQESSKSLPSWLTVKNQDVIVDVHAQPGAKRSSSVGEHGDRLKISVASPPVDGKANSALISFLAKYLDISKSSIQIVSGETSRQKRLLIRGQSIETIADKILRAL